VEGYRPTVHLRSPDLDNMLEKLQKLISKQQQSILMHISLVCLAYKMCKFYIVKDVLSKDDLLKVLLIKFDGLETLVK
jgi:hypothetical protein